MPLDAITVRALADELTRTVVGTKIDKVQQPARDLLVFSLRGNGANVKLLISAGTGTARAHLMTEGFENPSSPPMFCMLLRKHLVGARITGLSQPNMERMLLLELDAFDELGTETKKQLVVELMGRNSNVILSDADGHIIDCLRRVDGDMSRARQVLPGLIYRLPPKQEKPDFFALSAEERRERLLGAQTEKGADQWLLDSFSGLSPLICRELCFRAAGDVGRSLALFTSAEQEALLSEFSALEQRVLARDFTPTMLLRDGSPADFSFMPITQYENAVQTVEYADFSALLEAFYTTRERQEQMRRRSQSLHKSVKSAHERALRKLAARREEMRQTENRDEARKFGDLITANLYRLQKGARTAEVEDFFVEGSPVIQIALDPLKTPQQNAAAYYRAYNKAKTAQSYLGGLIEKGEKEAAYLLSVLDEITRCESERELQEIRRELTQTGFLKVQKTDKKEKIRETAPLRFLSSTGMEILVGRNNTQNDRLTTQTARRTDIWLHVQRLHGSHVIIRCDGAQPDEQTLFEAATLAAWHSQGRESGKLPVDYTQARFVKKPSGALPGAVIYTDYKTLLVSPDEKLVSGLQRLSN